MKFLISFSAALLLAYHVAFAVRTLSQNCVLDTNGVESCSYVPTTLPSVVRQSVPCAKTDMKCWCLKAKDYTNDVRRRRGMKEMLKVGPMKQLDNAVRYAKALGDLGFLRHQQLSQATREVGCGRFIGGENIAYNYNSGDVAKACVDQWEGSAGHLENILRSSFAEVVVGVHFEPDGRVYCVQTFTAKSSWGSTGSRNDRGCNAVSAGSSQKPTKPAPTKPVTTKPAPPKPPSPTQKPKTGKKLKNEGNRSCKCIELGKRCWGTLRKLSGNRCKPFTTAWRQPITCKEKCCSHCKRYPNAPSCLAKRVKRICRRL